MQYDTKKIYIAPWCVKYSVLNSVLNTLLKIVIFGIRYSFKCAPRCVKSFKMD